jgi:hypothetical protein
MITLPNGNTVEKAFRGIAVDQADGFSQVVRNGLLTGETTPSIAKRLMGRLERSGERLIFGEVATTTGQLRAAGVKSIVASGGELTAMADNQIMSLVRTSINQVANSASMAVYEANQDISKKYRYIATLDSRTSRYAGHWITKSFPMGEVQHRRSILGAVVQSSLSSILTSCRLLLLPNAPAQMGPVPINTSYGSGWQRSKRAKQCSLRARQEKSLGASKVPYFNRLVDKYGAKDAMAKLVRDDGSELTLEELRKRYEPA